MAEISDIICKECQITKNCSRFKLLNMSDGGQYNSNDISHCTLLYVYSGKVNVCYNKAKYAVSDHQLSIIGFDKSYILKSEGASTVMLFFPTDVNIKKDILHILDCNSKYATTKLSSYVYQPSSLINDLYSNIYELIKSNVISMELLKVKELELWLLLKTTMQLEDFKNFSSPFNSRRISFKTKVLAMMKDNKTVSGLAKSLGMNRSYFQRLFKSEFGESPSEWLIKHRCEYIVEYLHENDVPLKVAAEELEFSSMSQLSDYCRKYIGRTARCIQLELKRA